MQKLRHALKRNKGRMIARIQDQFPKDTRVSNPMGGCVLWIELTKGIDSELLFQQAIEKNISIAPGVIFSAHKKFRNFIRISYGMPWSDEIERAIDTLGAMIRNWDSNNHGMLAP